MSAEDVIKIIERAVKDLGFRELLSNNPASATAEYSLTEAEQAIFLNMPKENMDAWLASLEERISRAGGRKQWLPSNWSL